jgi:tetratricopeptide (TPR) repeat protein
MLIRILMLVAVAALTGCDKLITDKPKDKIVVAEQKAKARDYTSAIEIYESALDGTPGTAEIHYRLAVIYDDKLRRPADALHHFQRYLELLPNGEFKKEAEAYKKEATAKLVRSGTLGGPASQSELVRLKNENLNLQKQLLEARQRAQALSVTAAKRAEENKAPLPPGARKHVVQSGETLGTIALKYYGSKARSADILDANNVQLGGKDRIRPGQVLIIP